jgi:hypothetical protein
LVTAIFIPNRFHSNPTEMIHGIHRGFFVLGGWTILSTIIFWGLKPGDGSSVAGERKRDLPAG